MAVKFEHGFSLIELMMILAIMALLATAAAPLTGGWVKDADLTKVRGSLTQAVGRAKAASLRNFRGAQSNAPVAAICIANNTVTVREGTSANAPSCSSNTGTVVWQDPLDSDVTITSGGSAVSCLCFDNRGLLTNNACTGCSTTGSLTLTAGSHNDTLTIY